jgi:hypothetical protein
MTAEEVAREFHQVYERLAPDFGYKTRPESRGSWESVPDNNKKLMTAVVEELAKRRVINIPSARTVRR